MKMASDIIYYRPTLHAVSLINAINKLLKLRQFSLP